jgi:hypothetical protein
MHNSTMTEATEKKSRFGIFGVLVKFDVGLTKFKSNQILLNKK